MDHASRNMYSGAEIDINSGGQVREVSEEKGISK